MANYLISAQRPDDAKAAMEKSLALWFRGVMVESIGARSELDVGDYCHLFIALTALELCLRITSISAWRF